MTEYGVWHSQIQTPRVAGQGVAFFMYLWLLEAKKINGDASSITYANGTIKVQQDKGSPGIRCRDDGAPGTSAEVYLMTLLITLGIFLTPTFPGTLFIIFIILLYTTELESALSPPSLYPTSLLVRTGHILCSTFLSLSRFG